MHILEAYEDAIKKFNQNTGEVIEVTEINKVDRYL
jgi:hypothetical protein